jgi:hypothetical protein
MNTNSMTLYQLSADYLEALDYLTDPEVDVPMEAVTDTLDGFQLELTEKATNVAAFARNLEASAKAIKEAEQAMARRRRALENRSQWIKNYLKRNMEATGITKIECPWFVLSIRNNPPAVDVTDEAALPDDAVTVTLELDRGAYNAIKDKLNGHQVTGTKVDKAGLKARLQGGEAIEGARLERGTRLQIA